MTSESADILIVDDNEANLTALEAVLAGPDRRIVRARSGRECLRSLLDAEFAVVLMDVRMPDMDGFETADLMRGRDRTRHTPIIFLTAYEREDTQVFKGYSLGAVDYLFKPVVPEILRAKVDVFVELVKKTRQIRHQAELLREAERKKHQESLVAEKLRWEAERLRAEIEREAQLLAREHEARGQAEAANRAKDEFLATVSHELRTPLNAVLGWAQLLRGGNLTEAESRHGLEAVERNAKAQAKLVADLLDVSRIVSGRLQIQRHRVDLAVAVDAAIDSVRPEAAAKSVRIECDLDRSVDPVCGDQTRIQQVAWNLLSNAVKFTPSGGRIDVSLQRAGSGRARFEVRDNGKGISPAFLPHVFDRFRQADASTTRRHGGLGLGLAIARHLVKLHDGTIDAASPGEGCGAVFTVHLPTSRDAGPSEAELERIAAGAPRDLGGLRVLVVDDEADARAVLTVVLEQAGAQVVTASSAREAMDALRKHTPHVLLSDISMPGEDGYTLIRLVREAERESLRRLPAAAVTAYAAPENRLRALSAGYQMHITKPFEPDVVVSAVAGLASIGAAADPAQSSGAAGSPARC